MDERKSVKQFPVSIFPHPAIGWPIQGETANRSRFIRFRNMRLNGVRGVCRSRGYWSKVVEERVQPCHPSRPGNQRNRG